MKGFCKVIIAGNLTRDPEIRYLQSGTAVASFSVAINREWTQDGQKKSETTFVECSAFSKTAELIGQYLKKGNPILFEGRLKMDEWTDKQTNQKRSKLGVVVEAMTFLGGNSDQPATSTPPPRREPPKTKPATATGEPEEEEGTPF